MYKREETRGQGRKEYFFIKLRTEHGTEINVPIEDGTLWTNCPICGKEHEIPLDTVIDLKTICLQQKNSAKIPSERKRHLTKYGISIKVELLRRNKTQTWLIEEVKKILPGKYLDSSNLNKIMIGEISKSDIMTAIDSILGTNHMHEEG